MADTSTQSAGMGLAGWLTVAFVVLKLTHVIAWSWWWVISPALIGLSIGILFIAVMIAFSMWVK